MYSKSLCPGKNVDLHGSAPDKNKIALLLINVINDFDFPEADQLFRYAWSDGEEAPAT